MGGSVTFRVGIVAAACEFPEGRTPQELWLTALHGRRCFRRIPPQRLALDDYAGDEFDPDSVYPIEAALLEGYRFDRERFRVPKASFDRTDLSHWLALDVASRALASLSAVSLAGERDTTAVIVANTLTGEFSRANLLRYRWPYVERVVRSVAGSHLSDSEADAFVHELEAAYKAPFPAPDEDSLAGGLSNTIAGRIANHHGLHGGAHTVDGACASSLVAVVTAYERLAMGDVGCAVVGAVDLSLDPFELVGFARNGALARDLMHVFDERSDGFWPGEGCGFVVLATEEVVARNKWPVLAWICGAAMSSDGKGALTRPSIEGQVLAARRAWQRSGLSPLDADYFEAHGTGTPTGDPIELVGLAELLGSTPPRHAIPVGSIKANIGHTKAAAGMAGLLKAISVCRERVIPPTTGCDRPHLVLQGDVGARVNVRQHAQRIAHAQPATVGVNSFGFGGINCHVVVQGASGEPEIGAASDAPPIALRSSLTGELFTLQAPSREALATRLWLLERRAQTLSRAQLADLANTLTTSEEPSWRASVVASTPQELGSAAAQARSSLEASLVTSRHLGDRYCWSAPADRPPQIALLFPGQGTSLRMRPVPWAASFPQLAGMVSRTERLIALDLSDTSVVQPLLAEVGLAGLALLEVFGVNASVVLGHSFGELPALHAAGRITRETLRALAIARGLCMRNDAPPGSMLALQSSRDAALSLACAHELDLACENAPSRHVLAGARGRIEAAAAACAAQGIAADVLPSTRAFHSRLMGAARESFAKHLVDVNWQPARLAMVSSITGRALDGSERLSDLLAEQFVAPVKFTDAVDALRDVDLVVEVSATPALTGLVESAYPGRAVCLHVFDESLTPMLLTLGAVWAFGGRINRQALYEGRLLRECRLDDEPEFLSNPCGVPDAKDSRAELVQAAAPTSEAPNTIDAAMPSGESAIEALRRVLSELTGLAPQGLEGRLHLLADLHLNSIRARHAIALAARRLGLTQLPFDLARLANASVEEVAVYLEGLRHDVPDAEDSVPMSVAPWLRLLSHSWADADAPTGPARWSHLVSLDDTLAPLDVPCQSLLTLATPEDARCVIVVLPAVESAAAYGVLLRAAQQLLGEAGLDGLLVLQGAQLANGFLRSVSAELPHRRLCVVEYEHLTPATLLAAMAEYECSERGYSETRLRGALHQRRVLNLAELPSRARAWTPAARSVVIVTGGARGIGAATALALASRYACRLAIIGRSAADAAEVSDTLAALRDAGNDARYFRADLADAAQARAAVAAIESGMGQVTAVFHAAGMNRPMGVGALSDEEIAATLASKVASLDNLLGCVNSNQWELVVGYGSIIGELGLAGEAHYALANEWLNRLLARHARAAPQCLVVPICWSAWRQTGMATRLEGVLDGFQRSGTRALDTDEAIAALFRMLDSPPSGAVIACGRYGRSVDPASDFRLLQPHRYLERPRVFYPGIELVADAQLCSDVDRYLQDHAPFGVPVLPLVCALEAMVSAAQCLRPSVELPTLTGLQIGEAISCTLGQRFWLRTSALVQDDGSVRAEIRSETTGFDVVHFSARLSCALNRDTVWPAPASDCDASSAPELLYQGLCFHGPRFHRLGQVKALSATHCSVHTQAGVRADWYGPLLPQGFSAGDPGLRDAVLHALQLCVPHQVVLPVGAAQVQAGRLDPDTEYLICARQTFSDGRRFVFDIQVCDPSGGVVEQWTGLELVLAPAGPIPNDAQHPLAPALLQSLIARIATDVLGAREVGAGVVVGEPANLASGRALARALGRPVIVNREPDGAIAVTGSRVSTSHAADITVALTRREGRIAIDLQFAPAYELDEWRLMLGEARLRFAMQLSEQESVPLQQALLAAWTVAECLIKLGCLEWPLAGAACSRVATSRIGPVLVFDCGRLRLAVASLAIAGAQAQATLAIALEEPLPMPETTRAASEVYSLSSL